MPPSSTTSTSSTASTTSAAIDAVRLADYPQLRRLAWQLDAATVLTPVEALNLYERNWRHLDRDELESSESALLQWLIATVGGGRALV